LVWVVTQSAANSVLANNNLVRMCIALNSLLLLATRRVRRQFTFAST
jgi:hypothetical protein